MVRTGGTLSAKMIELIGDLNEQKTLSNINKSIRNIEKKLNNDNSKIKLNVELFARVEDMRKDISAIQSKIKNNSSVKDIKLGVGLEDITIKDINEQIAKAQARFGEGKSANTLKLDIEFDFKGSASKIKEEMDGIKQFMQRYGEQMNNMEPVNLGKSAQGVKRDSDIIKGSISNIGSETKKATQGISDQIEKEMRDATQATGKFSVNYKRDVQGTIIGANASIKSADGTMESFKYTLNETGNMLGQQSRATKIAGDATERYAKQVATVEDAQNKLNNAVKNAPEGFSSKAFSDAQANIDKARGSLEQYGKATDVADQAMTSFSNNLKITKKDLKFQEAVNETKNLADEFKRLGGSDEELRRITREIQKLSQDGSSNFDKLQSEIKESISEFQRLDKQMSETSRKEFRTAIEEQDIATVKRYVEEMKGASVASLRLSDAKDKEGNAISRVKVNMEAQNGAIQSSTLEYDKATGKVRELDKTTKTLSESNRGLDNSFGGILSRITQYFGAIQVLQKGMQLMKKTISEILAIDAQMIELARVADPSLNLDVMLERSVSLSKELGANVYDVVGVVGDMARTFGEFNEEQLLAIARTATIMQNVSELNLEQSSSTLVGTMKAFNIQAEDSIKIVNSFNEVDNNFAISTDQIANAMERAGATAQTFGIEMEELIGDITAIGEVTQESGERIGAALRTIYSRVTTHDKAIGMLEEVGISIREMGESGPQLRDVSDILGELGQIWGDLSSAQQQNMALQIAGRNRLTQFLALMNNQATAIDATTTAYNSQGSALREQKEYMQSYEYQMNILGATATDVALSIEDKFVGDAMYLVVTATTSVLEVLDDLIDKFGFLPVALGGATTAVLLFSKSVQGLAIPAVTQSIKGLLEAGMKMNPMISGISTKIFELATSLGPIKALLAGGVVVAGIMAIGWAIEKLVSKMAEAKKANEDAKHSMQEAIDTYRAQGNEINSLIDRYEELHNARKSGELNIEDEREYLDLVNQISTMLPNSISYIDAKGEAHLRSADSIRKEVEVLEGLASASAEAMKHDFTEDLIKMADDMEDAQDRNSKSIKKSETAMQSMNSQYKAYVESSEKASKQTGKEVEILEKEAFMRIYATESMEQYYEQASITNATSYEMSGLIQQSTVAIGDQTVALLNVGGKMKNTSTTAQALIRDYASMNDGMLQNTEGSKEYLEAQEKIKEQSIVFGEIVSGVYDDISEGLDEVDAQKAIDQFDQLLLALPEEEFQKGFDVIRNNMDGLQSIIGDVASGAEIDIEKVISQLEIAGMETDTASSFVIALGEAFEHQQIRAEVSKETLTEYNDELVRTKDTALEAFNPLEALFGFDSDSMKGLESHVNLLALMKNQYGETWHEMDKGQDSINAMADYFNISSDAIVENFDLYQDAIRAMGKMTTKLDENGKTVVEFGDDVSKATRDVVMGMLEAGDGFGGFADYMVTKTGVITQSQEEIAEKVEEVNDRFSKLGEGSGDRNAKNNLLNTLREDLEELRGSITYVEDEFGNFKLVMADGTRSTYLDNLNTQIEENNMSLNVRQDAEANWVVDIQNLATGAIDRIASLNEASINGALAVDVQREAVKKLINESTSEEEKKTFIGVLSTQMEAFGEDLDIVRDKTEGFKIQLAEDEQNPWLLGLNNLVEELGIKIDQTKDEAGNLQIEFQTKDGETFFTTAKTEVEELDEKIKDANKSADELTDPEKDRTVEIDYDDSNVKEGLIETEHDIDVVSGAEYHIKMDGDNTGIHDAVDDSNKKTDELEDKAVKLEIDAESLKTHNDIRKELHDTRLEIVDLEKALENIKKDLTVTNESMQNLMTNTKNINNAHSAIKNLNEIVDISIGKMGDLYAMFSSDAGIDTSGIENSAQKIADEAHSIERALVSIQGYITGMNLSLKGMDASFDITPITNYRLSVLNNAHLIASDISALAVVVSTQMAKVSEAFKQGNVSLAQVQIHTSNILGQVVILHRLTGEMITNYSLKASSDMLNNYNKGLVGILQATTTFKGLMDNHFKQFYTSMVQKVTMTAVDMRTKFTNGTNDIVKVAEGLPGRIGQGIRNNISQATSSMTALASSMVTRFKRELGIHSPSRVFTELGGHVIDGLVNGLTGSDITNLGQTVFSDFSDGAISTINEIKGYMTFEPVTAGSFGAGFTKTSGFGPRKSPGGIGSTNHRGVDFAAPMGTPIPSQSSGVVTGSGYNGSMGNYIKIRSGDGKEHIYMHQSKRNVGVGQKVGRGQIIGHVGSTGNSTGPHVHYEIRVNGVPIDPTKRFRGFAEGGFVDKKELAWHGEEGLEAIIPLIPERRERGLDLWRQSGEILGMNADLLKMLMGTRRKSAEYGGSSGFAGLDGEAGEGSSESGTSGVVKPDTSSIMRAFGIGNEPMFTSMASKEKPEALYRRDYASIRTSMHEDMVAKANIELKALTEQTLAYRNALALVSTQENKLKKDTESRLKSTVKRQRAIEKELGTLRNTSKHTVKQRKRYNELQQEYDKNTESIMSMENSIRNLNIAMDERKVEIYIDYFKQLSKQYDISTESLERTMARSQYYLDRVTLEDENDIGKQQSWRNDVIKQTIILEDTLLNQQRLLGKEYDKAKKKYGSQSEQALFARSELIRVEDAYRSTVLERIKKEQESEKIRKDIADNGIKALKDYYSQTQAITDKAIELERKALEKAHQEKMDRYDKEISKIESVYDAQLKEMDENKAEEEYQEQISALNEQRSELMLDISRASRDTSLEGRKRLAELQSELSDVNAEIQSTQKERQEELYRTAIENQKKAQIEAIEAERETEEKKNEIRMNELDKQAEDAKKYAESIINDNAFWERLSNQFVAGDTDELDALIEDMQFRMADFASGNFEGVSLGYDKLSKEDRDKLSEDVLLDISNSILEFNDDIKKYISASNTAIEKVAGEGYKYGTTQMTGGKTPSLSTQAQSGPTVSKPKPKPSGGNKNPVLGKKVKVTDVNAEAYMDSYGRRARPWGEQAKSAGIGTNQGVYLVNARNGYGAISKTNSVRGAIAWVKLDDLVGLRSGGYTGDWSGDGGKVAMLHKRELILNEAQTRDILDVAKIVDSIAGIIPKMKVNRPNISTTSSNVHGDTYEIDNLNLNMKDFKGSKEDAEKAFDNMAKELKKRGRR